MSILEIRALSKAFGGLKAVQEIDAVLEIGETLSIIGPNGAGKTTLFNLITGTDRADSGTVTFEGEDITALTADERARFGLIRTFQHGRTFGNLSVLDNVLAGAHVRRRAAASWFFPLTGLREILQTLGLGPGRKEEKELREQARELLALFGKRLLPRIDDPAFSLSYANRRRVEIARALFARPRILFLDEPTAGMNPAETLEMVEFLKNLKRLGQTMVIIEHKLPLVLPLSDRLSSWTKGEKSPRATLSPSACTPGSSKPISAAAGSARRDPLRNET